MVAFPADQPLTTDGGRAIAPLSIAYEIYGALNAARSNAILLCHALTGDQYAASVNPLTGKPGWWDALVGPGKPFDTDRYFVICTNVVGGCMGSTGPASINPATGRAYGLEFPVVTIRDMVRAQAMLIDHFRIDSLFCVAGGSMGGMQALQWAASYPERVFSAMSIAAAARHSSQNIAFHEVGRQAIMADPDWRGGRYLEEGVRPEKGLAVARMAAHITYLSELALQRKFGRKLQERAAPTFSFDADFQIESYLRHQGVAFVERFDANSYLFVTRACDYFDLAADYGGSLARAFQASKTRFCVVSFTSDWLYPTSASRAIVHALNAAAASVSFVEIESDKGHDAFLLYEPDFFATMRGFLDSAAKARGLPPGPAK
ncbi:MAG TPA: homoserine O-acetyltransferase [Methylocystis sp.]|nr:homoserine O-acetyltransferase [Methylocystis sp.]